MPVHTGCPCCCKYSVYVCVWCHWIPVVIDCYLLSCVLPIMSCFIIIQNGLPFLCQVGLKKRPFNRCSSIQHVTHLPGYCNWVVCNVSYLPGSFKASLILCVREWHNQLFYPHRCLILPSLFHPHYWIVIRTIWQAYKYVIVVVVISCHIEIAYIISNYIVS